MNPVTLDELRWFARAVRVGRDWRAASQAAKYFGFFLR